MFKSPHMQGHTCERSIRSSSFCQVPESSSSLSCRPPGSSTDVSEDWEKDFDLDMTEEEVQLALSKMEDPGEVSCFNKRWIRVGAWRFTDSRRVFVSPAGWGVGELGVKRLCGTKCPAFEASSRPRNHAYRVLTLCPHHVMTVVRGFSGPQWLSCWVSNRKTMASSAVWLQPSEGVATPVLLGVNPQLVAASRMLQLKDKSPPLWGFTAVGQKLFFFHFIIIIFSFCQSSHFLVRGPMSCMMARTRDAARHLS